VRFWIVVASATVAAVALLFTPYVIGDQSFYHDSLAHASVMGLFYDRLYSGDSILWSAALNGGQPLWASLEITPVFDPFASIVYFLAVALEWSWLTPYQVVSFIWVFVFALGAAGCTRILTDDKWSAALTFIILLIGPMYLAAPAASSGLVIPFRYSSLVIYLYLRLRRKITIPRLVLFTTTLAFSLAGYQSIYPFIFYLCLVLVELLFGGRAYLSWVAELLAPRRLWPWLFPVLALLPSLAWFDYTKSLVPIPWTYGTWLAFFFREEFLAWDLFLVYHQIIASGPHRTFWHGSSFLGLVALPLLCLALRVNIFSGAMALRAAGAGKPSTGNSRTLLVLSAWLLVLIILATGAFGLRDLLEGGKALLGVRNPGFLLSGVVLLMAVMVGQGLSYLKEERHVLAGIAFDTVVFAVCVWTAARWIGQSDSITTPLVIVVGLFLFVSLAIRALRKWMAAETFASLITVLVLLEMLPFSLAVMPSMEHAAARFGTVNLNLDYSAPPKLGTGQEQLPTHRVYEFPARDYWPGLVEGPAIYRVASAMTPAAVASPFSEGVHYHSQLFRLRNYDNVLNSGLGRGQLEQIFGVTRPILEIVRHREFEEGAGGLRLVTRGLPDPRSGAETGAPEPLVPNDSDLPSLGQILRTDYAGDRVSIDLHTSEDAVLVYRDNVAADWSVTVDGTPAELLVVDGINKAVAVPPGEHRVVFVYRPWPYLISFALRTMALLTALAACAWLAARALARLATT
jgi:hypothetical protein